MLRVPLFLFFFITNAMAFEIFHYKKQNWELFKGLKPLHISQDLIVHKLDGSIGSISEEIDTNIKISLSEKCRHISKNALLKSNYCKVNYNGMTGFLFQKKYETASLYQLVTFKNKNNKGIADFEEGLK